MLMLYRQAPLAFRADSVEHQESVDAWKDY